MRQAAVEKFLKEPAPADFALYARMLMRWRMTPTAFAMLPDDEQVFMLGGELYRQRALSEFRQSLSDDDPKKSKLTPEVFTMIALQRL